MRATQKLAKGTYETETAFAS